MTLTAQHTDYVGKKENKAFMILSALGIVFVVDVHISKCLSPLVQIFPYDSFFMPMFAFISGYFFTEKHCRSWNHVFQFSWRKFKKLMLPYLGWILFYGVLISLLRWLGILDIRPITLIDLIHNILTSGTSFAFNSPAWFVPTLFCVSVCYCFIRKIVSKHWNDSVAMILFALAGAAAVWASRTSFNTNNHYMLMKVPFFLQFYHLGIFFRNKLEHWFDRTSCVALCVGAMIINIFLVAIYGNNIAFPICSSMSGFYTNNPFLPLITSITGIAFWLKISKALVPILGQNKLVNFISDNTFFIMTHHIGAKHLFLGILICCYRCGMEIFSGIDIQQFRTDGLYVYGQYAWCNAACFLFSMAFLLISCKAFHAAKARLKQAIRGV